MVTYPVKKQLKKFFCRGFKSFQIMAQFFKTHAKLKNFLEREIIHFIPWTQKLNKYVQMYKYKQKLYFSRNTCNLGDADYKCFFFLGSLD